MENTPASRPQGQILGQHCIVYFGNDWFTENRTSSHHIAKRLGGIAPVLYVQTPGIRAPRATARDFRKLYSRLAAMFDAPRRINDRFHVITMPQIPLRRLPLVGLLNRCVGAYLVRRAMRKLGFRNVVSWFVVPHPGALAGKLGDKLTVYYCVDDFSSFPGVDAPTIRKIDDELTSKADILFVAAPILLEAKRGVRPDAHFSPHGVDAEMFAQAADRSIPPAEPARGLQHPVIGYFGNLGQWINFDLILYLARSRPQWTFLLIGYAAGELGELRSCPNVVLPGPQPYETLPSWARAFDVAIIPYLLTQQVKFANPLKLREYLATGKPVVSVTTPETARFAGLVQLADTPEDYLAAIERALRDDSPELGRQRMDTIAPSSWDARFQETVATVEAFIRQRE